MLNPKSFASKNTNVFEKCFPFDPLQFFLEYFFMQYNVYRNYNYNQKTPTETLKDNVFMSSRMIFNENKSLIKNDCVFLI